MKMTVMKSMYVECDCGWSDEVDDSRPEFDEYYDLDYDAPCPGCKKKLAEAV